MSLGHQKVVLQESVKLDANKFATLSVTEKRLSDGSIAHDVYAEIDGADGNVHLEYPATDQFDAYERLRSLKVALEGFVIA